MNHRAYLKLINKSLNVIKKVILIILESVLLCCSMVGLMTLWYSLSIGGCRSMPSILVFILFMFFLSLGFVALMMIDKMWGIRTYMIFFLRKRIPHHFMTVLYRFRIILIIGMAVYAFFYLKSNIEVNEKTFLRWEYSGDVFFRIPLHYPYEISESYCEYKNEDKKCVGLSFFVQSSASEIDFKDELTHEINNITSFTIVENNVYGIAKHLKNDQEFYFCFDSLSGRSRLFLSKDSMETELRNCKINCKTYFKTKDDWFKDAWDDYWGR